MTKKEKQLQKLRQNPKNVSPNQLQQVLEDYGFELDRVTGSHHIFYAKANDKSWRVVVPFRNPVKIVYVKQAIIAIDEVIMETKDNA